LVLIPRIGRLSIKADEMTDYIQVVYDQAKKAIKDSNTTYKAHYDSHRRKITFGVSDFVWVLFTRDCFPIDEYNKLQERKIEHCEILQKINNNAYRLHLPSHLKTHNVFNVKYWIPCFVYANKDDLNSRASSFQFEEIDAGEDRH
jgi:hypothetical protein